jgi:hypothetical protein
MNKQDDSTLRESKYGGGIVECRICGLNFLPELEEDRERHEHEHRRIIWGGLPYDIREFIKRAAWEAAECPDGVEGDDARRAQEIAKRTVAFAHWARAASNGIPENDFEPCMSATLALVDATIADDEEKIDEANEALSRWREYG